MKWAVSYQSVDMNMDTVEHTHVVDDDGLQELKTNTWVFKLRWRRADAPNAAWEMAEERE